jgi:hypothetical protein
MVVLKPPHYSNNTGDFLKKSPLLLFLTHVAHNYGQLFFLTRDVGQGWCYYLQSTFSRGVRFYLLKKIYFAGKNGSVLIELASTVIHSFDRLSFYVRHQVIHLFTWPGLPDGLFSNQISQFWRAVEWKTFGIFYDNLEYYTAIWYKLWPLGIVCGHLVQFSHFGTFGPRKIWQPCTWPNLFSAICPLIKALFKLSWIWSSCRRSTGALEKVDRNVN